MPSIRTTRFRDRYAVCLENDILSLIILPGGGHIASLALKSNPLNPLWEPTWAGLEPNVRAIADPETYGESLESILLTSIAGHNLCCDVFGDQSKGEQAVGLTFHGEAGMMHWSVGASDPDAGVLVMEVDLPHTALSINREFRLPDGAETVIVTETVLNNVGFERALGIQQHVSLGHQFLDSTDSPALFACNADRGRTWPEAVGEQPYNLKVSEDFDFPDMPSLDGGSQDWRKFPRHESSADLCTLRIRHADEVGWFSAHQPKQSLTIAYAWEREQYPWLMTWEECHDRQHKPWNGGTLARGLEFGSYAYATSRRDNVKRAEMFDTPCYTWMDAYEERETTFSMTVRAQEGLTAAPGVTTDEAWGIALV
jgi:hypothetical protein